MVLRLQARFVGLGRRWDATSVGLGATFALLIGMSLWASAVGHGARYASRWLDTAGWFGAAGPLVVVSGLTSLGGLVLGSIAYARSRGLELGIGLPERGSWPAAVGVAVAPVALVVGAAAAGNAVFGVTLSAMSGHWISPDASVRVLLLTVVPPATFAGLGYGFLLCGIVYERVHALIGPDDAVAVAAALVGFFWLLPVDVLGIQFGVGGAVEVVLSLVFGVAFGAGLGVVRRRLDDDELAALVPGHALVVGVALVGVVGAATELAELPGAVGDLLWIAVLGIAVLGYERTRSVWVPALSIAAFNAAVSGVVYVESLRGLAVP